MTDQHPITTPPELVQQWITEAPPSNFSYYIADHAAEWGYDQRGEVNEAKMQKARDEELEACCEWLDYNCPSVGAHHLRAALRPKPSLAEQGLAALRSTPCTEQCQYDALFAALTRLKQLEDSDD